jgi:hypothetical protein
LWQESSGLETQTLCGSETGAIATGVASGNYALDGHDVASKTNFCNCFQVLRFDVMKNKMLIFHNVNGHSRSLPMWDMLRDYDRAKDPSVRSHVVSPLFYEGFHLWPLQEEIQDYPYKLYPQGCHRGVSSGSQTRSFEGISGEGNRRVLYRKEAKDVQEVASVFRN